MALAESRISQSTLSWAGTVSYFFIIVSGVGNESLALRFIMASPAWLAEGGSVCVEEAALCISRPIAKGRRVRANT